MKLIKNGQEADYNILDKQIASHFNSFYNPDTFTCLPNNTGIYVNLDWYSLLSQGETHSYDAVIDFYRKDLESTIIETNKTLEQLVPQLFRLIDFLKNNNYQIS